MRKNPDERPQDIAELYEQMVSRDQAMWNQLTERDRRLQDGMMELFSRILENTSVDRVMAQGFSAVSEQLKEQLSPLRDLTPRRAPLDAEQKALLGSIRRALARPDFDFSSNDAAAGRIITASGNESGGFGS
jgi:hypothetical protein